MLSRYLVISAGLLLLALLNDIMSLGVRFLLPMLTHGSREGLALGSGEGARTYVQLHQLVLFTPLLGGLVESQLHRGTDTALGPPGLGPGALPARVLRAGGVWHLQRRMRQPPPAPHGQSTGRGVGVLFLLGLPFLIAQSLASTAADLEVQSLGDTDRMRYLFNLDSLTAQVLWLPLVAGLLVCAWRRRTVPTPLFAPLVVSAWLLLGNLANFVPDMAGREPSSGARGLLMLACVGCAAAAVGTVFLWRMERGFTPAGSPASS